VVTFVASRLITSTDETTTVIVAEPIKGVVFKLPSLAAKLLVATAITTKLNLAKAMFLLANLEAIEPAIIKATAVKNVTGWC